MERPKVGVGVIVVREGKVLMQRRTGAHGEGTWSFPGGHLEGGETPEACARRETREEVGVEIADLRRGPYTNDVHEREGKHYITLFIVSEWAAGEPRICEPDRTLELGWFSWDELPRPLFLPIEHLLAQGYRPPGA